MPLTTLPRSMIGALRPACCSATDAARRYLDRIEALADTPIAYVSVGTRRDQIIGVG